MALHQNITSAGQDESKTKKMFRKAGFSVIKLDIDNTASRPDFLVLDPHRITHKMVCEVKTLEGSRPKNINCIWEQIRNEKLYPAQEQYRKLISDDPYNKYNIGHKGTFKGSPFVVALFLHSWTEIFSELLPFASILYPRRNMGHSSNIHDLNDISAVVVLEKDRNIKEYVDS